MPKFKTVSGHGVTIYAGPGPITILHGQEVETDDPDQIEALKNSPEVVEVKDKERSREPSRDFVRTKEDSRK